LRLTLGDRLRREGYAVETAADGGEGFGRASSEPFHLVVLDIMLPVRSGLDVCRDLRQANVRTPVLMLTARGETLDKVTGLKLGADDYLTKPFDMNELLARIEALLRRASQPANAAAPVYRFGGIQADFLRTEITRGGTPVLMTAKEVQLLRFFVEHRGETLSRERLLTEVWGYGVAPSTRTVDVHVAWLRQKLEDNPKSPKYILTVHGLGYKFAG
jgi:two-component system alkaline phosphatase synthesis response regulator PhoP